MLVNIRALMASLGDTRALPQARAGLRELAAAAFGVLYRAQEQEGTRTDAAPGPRGPSIAGRLGGLGLFGGGRCQRTAAKEACRRHCRAPAHCIAERWRRGIAGAFRMGAHHGAYCLGCCWALMGLLFFGGVMNLFWIAGLAVFVLIEKLATGSWVSRISGALLITCGVGLALSQI